jgi:enhancing lycopene biosynthesis protein 2/pterin-4a-carbinolamine dehydratase
MSKRIAVLLSGSGVLDGAEIHESVLTLLALEEAGAEIVMTAPSGPQLHVVNHLSGGVSENEQRDMLVEAARIARGQIIDLESIDISRIDGVILPGGFGVAKNLCTFALHGADCQVHPRVRDFLIAAKERSLPMGFACISPALAAAVFREGKFTLGSAEGPAVDGLRGLGAKHVVCKRDEIICDAEHKIVSTPAYMAETTLKALRLGLKRMVNQVMTWANQVEHSDVLSSLPGWSIIGQTLVKTWQLDDDVESLKWVNRVWALAQEANHHPDIQLGYNTVTIELTTHDQKRLTQADYLLARQIDLLDS